MTTEVASLMNVFGADLSGFDAGIARVKSGLAGAASNAESMLGKVSTKVSSFGRNVGVAILPLTAAFTGAVYGALGFDEALTNIQAVTGQTDAQISELYDTILDKGMDSRYGPQAVADAYYDIVGGVADATTWMAIMDASIATAEAGNAKLDGTTRALISTMNSYSFSAEQAGYVSDVFTRTVGMGVGTMDEFAAAFPAVTGMANSLKIPLDDIGAAMAYLTTKGNTASEASTQLSGIMTALINPSKEMSDALRGIGFESGQAALEQLGLTGTLAALKAAGYEDDFGAIFGRVEALRGAIALSDPAAAAFFDTYDTGLTGITERSREIQDASPAAEFDRLKGQMQGVSIVVGTALLPALSDLMGKVGPLATTFANWAQENPQLIQTLGVLVFGLAGLSAVAVVVGPAIGVIASAIGLLNPPLLLGALLLGAYTGNLGGFRDKVNDVGKDLRQGDWDGAAQNVTEALISIPKGIADQVVNVDEGMAGWGRAFDGFKEMVSALPGFFLEKAIGLIQNINTYGPVLAAVALQFGTNLLTGVVNGIGDLAAAFAGKATGLITKINELGPALLNVAQAFGANILSGIVGSLVGLGASVVEKLRSELSGIAGTEILPGLEIGDISGAIGLGDGKAGGGPVSANVPYLVGERGPEMFVPGQSGQIITNRTLGSLSGGGGEPIYLTVQLDSGVLFEAQVREGGRRNVTIFAGAG